MKIGILTFHGVDNYGAVLQAYALNRALQRKGREIFFIDYRPDEIQRHYRWNWSRRGLLRGCNVVNAILGPRFANFRRKHLPISKRSYRSLSELSEHPPSMDVALFGSDQIWNPEMFAGRFDPAYFGSFVAPATTRIAYAASFGRGTNLDAHRTELKALLEPFKAISVREERGADLIADTLGRRPEVVLDPTLLIDNYEELMEPVRGAEGGFVFLFAMQYGPGLKMAAEAIADRLKLPVVMAISFTTGLRLFDRAGRGILASPGQWIWLIKNASFVVTNSFHGTVFSMIYRRPFVVVPLKNKMAGRNERLLNVLQLAGISQRMVAPEDDLRRIGEAPIDWEVVSHTFSLRRRDSLAFLESSLEGKRKEFST